MARAAFVEGMVAAALICAVIAVGVAILTVVSLRDAGTSAPVTADAGTDRPDTAHGPSLANA